MTNPLVDDKKKKRGWWWDSSVGRALDRKAGCNTNAGLISQCEKGFFFQDHLSVPSL